MLTYSVNMEHMKNSNVSSPTQKHSKDSRGVLIERAHYYTILVEGVRNILEGALIEGGALTEVVWYVLNKLSTVNCSCTTKYFSKIFCCT